LEKKMKCPKCEFDNPEDSTFCGKCGSSLEVEVICPNCGSKPPQGFNFCNKCGHDLRKPKEEALPLDFSQPQSYTPKFLADKILTARSSIEGERKLVTVLFSDVANYTSMAEKLDPEEVHQIMDGCFKMLMEEIHRHEGTINQFTGDGVMAIFGAPVAHEDHAQRACHAALSIQKAIGEYGENVKRDCGVEFKMRIGLNTGPVVVGAIGDDLRMDYTAIGDTTNLAARMENLAKPGDIVVSKGTHRLVREFFELESLGKVEVKGKDELQEAYGLIKAGEISTKIEAAIAKGLTRFVGRTNSMADLMEVCGKFRSGSGQVVGVVGEAGVGKSRLLLEFKNLLPRGEFTYLQGRCLHFGGAMAYLPVVDILKSYFDIKEADREFIIKKKMKEKILQLDERLQGVLPPFEDLLSLKVEDEAYLNLEPKHKRVVVFEAIRDLLIRESQNRPLVLAVEDLHWIDKTSEEFLSYLIGWLTSTPILLILLYRPEYTHQWGSKSYYNRIGLEQLTTKSSAELVKAILEGAEVVPELKELILSRTGGNPLFLEEFTHSLIENGSIERKDNQYVLTRKASDIQIPDTIQGIIAARMDRLEDNLKRTMQVASVIGRDFAFRILQIITGMREELKSYLLNLQGLELIYEKSLFPELEYIFKHALIQEVAYNSLLLRRRKEIHEKIGKAIEQIYPERLEEFYEMLAYHYYEGEDWAKALEYLAKAGDKFAAAYANQEALDSYAKALEVCEILGESTLETSGEVAKRRGWVNITIGDFTAAIEDFNRMLATARRLGNRHLEGMALAYRGRAEHHNHEVETSVETLKAALAVAEEGFEDVRFFVSITLGAHFLIYNRHIEAKPLLLEAEKLASEVDDPFILGWWSVVGSLWLYWEGRFDEALRFQARWHGAIRRGGVTFLMNSWVEALARIGKGEYERALALLQDMLDTAERMGDIFWRARALNTIGWLNGELQDHRQAMEWNMQGVEVAREAAIPNLEVEINARLNLGDNLLALDRLDVAEEHFQKVEEEVQNPRPQDLWMLWRYSQHLFHSYGELWLARGNLDKAMQYADECLALAEQSNSQRNVVKSHRLRAQVFLAQSKLPEAEKELSIALRVAQQVGNPTQLWKTYAVLGDLLQAQGRPDDARQAYSDAVSVIEEVAAGLKDKLLRDTFMNSHLVQEIRHKAQGESLIT
jgi:class 3 adenylate cyclase/tetratricopeptide (TPR) repeat protein/ribosomal protein L40E